MSSGAIFILASLVVFFFVAKVFAGWYRFDSRYHSFRAIGFGGLAVFWVVMLAWRGDLLTEQGLSEVGTIACTAGALWIARDW